MMHWNNHHGLMFLLGALLFILMVLGIVALIKYITKE